jgi:hypothetical protein
MSKASKKTDRRITPLEHAQLKKDAAAVEAARDVIDDATVALKPNEEIDIESGVIQLKPPAPPVQG